MRRVVAAVSDLFFVARVRETARMVSVPLEFARTADELRQALAAPAAFVLVDLTTGGDRRPILEVAAAAGTPVLGFTTHALAETTRPLHARCHRVVTKETLTRELPALLERGILR